MHRKRTLRGLGISLALCSGIGAVTLLPSPSGAAQRQTVPVASQAKGKDADKLAAAAIRALGEHPRDARVSEGVSFRAVSTLVDPDGTTHTRLDRTYKGVPVLGGDLVVHLKRDGAWKGISQTLGAPLEPASSAGVTADRALTEARAPRDGLRGISGVKAEGKPRLVVDATGSAPRLAWEVTTTGTQYDGTPSRLATYVDAADGKVIRDVQQIRSLRATDLSKAAAVSGDTPGAEDRKAFEEAKARQEASDGSPRAVPAKGRTLYGGEVDLGAVQVGDQYVLQDPAHGWSFTTDMLNLGDGPLCSTDGYCWNGVPVTADTALFGDGTNDSRDSAAADAQYGTDATWDYYNDVHRRQGIWDIPVGSYNRVHYQHKYVNAFWDGEKMTYGDGDGVEYGPLTSLDVAGHEMSHGVTENTARLAYFGESGGLNEATSDIFGTMVEFHADNATDRGDYLVGEQFDLKEHTGFRRMDDPASDGDSLGCWSPRAKLVDVHYSSGIGNHFYYLLAEGSGEKTINGTAHNSPTCDGSAVTGIGRDKAQAVWYRALTTYMTALTDYRLARVATLRAAADLYGEDSAEYTAVGDSWDAVGVTGLPVELPR
ncbi:M4 family metallopeptidase [Streptomyces sp. LD120]|uniref:Neutral metalloproteinase n=2 Tax=Streptomyces physcomitrii TaxID=2724184 RepID=A0ABX1H164_9ACTN|nr:M4 family metallopeptidase [Streptomyces physcomitrii]